MFLENRNTETPRYIQWGIPKNPLGSHKSVLMVTPTEGAVEANTNKQETSYNPA